MSRDYMALQTEYGWFVARIGHAGLRVISDRLQAEVAAGACNILNDIFTDDWTVEHIKIAYSLVPDLLLPIWLPSWVRDRYDPIRIARRARETPLDRKANEHRSITNAAKNGEYRGQTGSKRSATEPGRPSPR